MSRTLGINGWRIHGQRTGVGRYLLSIVERWNRELVNGSFEHIRFYTPRTVDRTAIPLPGNIEERVIGPHWRMLVWENLRFGPVADDSVLFCPSYSRPFYTRGKVVVTIFEATLKLYPQYFPKVRWYQSAAIRNRLYEWSAHHSAFVLTTTECAKADIVRAYGVPAEKVRVVPLAPADIFRSISNPSVIQRIRQRYLNSDAPYFLFVGKFTPRRNIDKLIRAFAEFKRRDCAPHKLVLIGKDTVGVNASRVARECGVELDVHHLGFVDDADLVVFYAGAYAFVLPYSYEVISLTAIEAQAAGLPVITLDTPGLRECTGDAALYLSRPEIPEIAQSLRTLAGEPGLRQELSKLGLEHASKLSWDRTARETLALLREAAG